MSDPLVTVARLRNLAVEEARRALADCLTQEATATDALRRLDAAIAAETDAASDPSGNDQAVADFAVWLRRISIDRAAADAALAAAETGSAEARADLAASRSAAQAMDALLAGRATERQAAADRREQGALDEAGRYKGS